MKRALAQIRQHPSRFGALLLAITISVGFVTTCLVFIATQSAVLRDQISAPSRHADIVVSPNPDHGQQASRPDAVRARLAAVPGVTAVANATSVYFSVAGADVRGHASLAGELQWGVLTSGSWPRTADEIVVGAELAKSRNLAIGDPVKIAFYGPEAETLTLRVSGIAQSQTTLVGGVSLEAFVTPDFIDRHEKHASSQLWLVKAAPGSSLDTVLQDTTAAVSTFGEEFVVQSRTAYADTLAKDLAGGVDLFNAILLPFGAIATLVGMLIIANTFTILIAQRRRQIGLMRAVGAQSGQVQRDLLAEAFVLGLIGSALGVGIGIGLAALGSSLLNGWGSGLQVPGTVAISFAVGVLVTVLAAWLPSIRTSAIKPLEALRVAATESARQRPGLASTIVAAIFLLGGVGMFLVTLNAEANQLVLAVATAMLIAIGVLAGAGWYVPGLVRLLGAIPARLGTTSRLAVANAVRNPRRTTATCLALMLAVGLIVTLQVGSASVKASAEAGIANRFPIALTVSSGSGEALPGDLATKVRAVDGVTAATTVTSGTVEVDDSTWYVVGVPAEIGQVVPGFGVGPDDLVLSAGAAKGRSWIDGQRVRLDVGSGPREMTVRISHVGDMADAVVAAETLQRWSPQEIRNQVWAAVDTRDADGARATMDEVKALGDNLSIEGAIAFIVVLTQVLDVLLMVATGLLAAAVLIALIGVGNTLGLSVLERTRESALLRALGLQRSQLRATLAIEALLLAVAGAIVGILAGFGFGVLGTWALMREMGEAMVVSVSWPLLAVDAGIAVVAGLLASVLPARKAALAAPTEALAEA